jgi:hypothetical protein
VICIVSHTPKVSSGAFLAWGVPRARGTRTNFGFTRRGLIFRSRMSRCTMLLVALLGLVCVANACLVLAVPVHCVHSRARWRHTRARARGTQRLALHEQPVFCLSRC